MFERRESISHVVPLNVHHYLQVEKPCVSPGRRRKREAGDEEEEDEEEEEEDPPLVDIFLNPARREEIQS